MYKTSRAVLSIYDTITFHPKKIVAIYTIYSCLYLYMIIMMNPSHDDSIASMLNLMIAFILYIISAWVVMDIYHPVELTLISELGYQRMFILKWVFILIYLWLLSITLYGGYVLIKLIYGYPFILNDVIYAYIHLLLDLILLSAGTLLLSRYKHPTLALIIPIIMILWRMMTFDEGSLLLYQIIPIDQSLMHTFSLVIPYKLCYISIVWLYTTFQLKKVVKT